MSKTDTAEPVSAELVQYTPTTVEEYRPRIVMAPDEAKALDGALRENMKAVLHDGVDYGVIPGTGNKPTLLKPGAEKLLQWFGFGHTMEQVETERDADQKWQGVTYRCSVTKAMPDGRVVVVGTCEGYAGYDEDRFYLSAEAATAKEQANADRYHRQVNQAKCVEYRAPRNSVVKMAQKRALVGAALQATSASTLFTQDVEDTHDPGVSAAGAIASAASDVIAGLPEEARRGVDTWRREKNWPKPGEWSPEQWCAALVQAGRLDASLPGSMARAQPMPPEDPWTTPEVPEDWVNQATAKAPSLATKADASKLYEETIAKAKRGEITEQDKVTICNLILARVEELDAEQQPVEGAVSAPDGDPWQAEINSMTTREDAIPLLDKLDQQHKGGVLDSRRHKALKAAVRTRADSLPSAPGAGLDPADVLDGYTAQVAS